MKILLLITSLMFYRAGPPSKKTYYINKDAAVKKKLNDSVPLFQKIANEMMGIKTNNNNNTLCFTIDDFKEMKNAVFLTGKISEEHLSVKFWIQSLDQLNNFNQSIISYLEFEKNIKFRFTSMVISLINNIFQSSEFSKEDIEISSNEESFLADITNLFKKNKNKVTISVTHKYETQIKLHCSLNKNAHNVVKNSEPNESQEHDGAAFRDDSQEAAHNPNESQEHEGAALLDKKRQ